MWKVVETKAGKVGVAEAEGRGEERRSRKEMRRKGVEGKKENNRDKESSRRMG